MNVIVKAIVLIVTFLITYFLGSTSLSAQEKMREINRFQYHKFKWKVFYTPSYHIYYPEGYEALGQFTADHLFDIVKEVKLVSGIQMNNKPSLIIYPSVDQFYETNIGRFEHEVQHTPYVQLNGYKMVLAFDGSYENLRAAIYKAVVRLGWEEIFKQSSDEVVNTSLLVPYWYREGVISYFASGWSLEDEQHFLKLLLGKDAIDWEVLSMQHPEIMGQAFCYYLSVAYREDVNRQILSYLRQGKSLARSVRLVTKKSLDTLKQEFLAFYQFRLNHAIENTATPLADGRLSPDGKYLVRIVEKDNKKRVYVRQMSEVKREHFLTSYTVPPWLGAHYKDDYPIVSWSRNSAYVYIGVAERGKIKIKKYDVNGRMQSSHVLYGVDGLAAMFEVERDSWLLAAHRKGQSDIVHFQPSRSRFMPLTNDVADNDFFNISLGDSLRLLYRSGYPADALSYAQGKNKAYGIYYKSTVSIKEALTAPEQLIRKDSLYYQWRKSLWAGGASAVVENNISGYTSSDTLWIPHADQANAYSNSAQESPWVQMYRNQKAAHDSIAALKEQAERNNVPLLSRILPTQGHSDWSDSMRKVLAFDARKVKRYQLSLSRVRFSARLSNDFYINRYQPYKEYLGSYKVPEMGAMLQGGFSDLLEHHHFNLGYRMPSGLDGSDFFIHYENAARKMDWHLFYFRKVESLQQGNNDYWVNENKIPYPAFAKVKTNYLALGLHYPLHYDWSLKLNIAARNDKTIFPATNSSSLRFDNLQQWWNINTLGLTVNKLQPTVPMLYRGWKGSITLDGFVSDGNAATVIYGAVIGLSKYQRLYKNITLTLDAQFGHSGGDQRILYNFGGVDHNVMPKTDTTVSFKQEAPYVFQSLITPLRGYRQNSIYGSSFALLNVGLYAPVLTDLLHYRTSVAMFNHFQLGLFIDFAAAMKREEVLPAAPDYLYAYGFSARTLVAGYRLQFDFAWPESFQGKPVAYLSLVFNR